MKPNLPQSAIRLDDFELARQAALVRLGRPINGINLTHDQKMHNLRFHSLNVIPLQQEQFDMGVFHSGGYYPSKPTYECGTVACFLGYAMMFGFEALPGEDWIDMGYRLFISTSAEWCWCFGDVWHQTDPSPQAAAARGLWLAEHGLPENWQEQMFGEPPCPTAPLTEN